MHCEAATSKGEIDLACPLDPEEAPLVAVRQDRVAAGFAQVAASSRAILKGTLTVTLSWVVDDMLRTLSGFSIKSSLVMKSNR